MIIDISPLPPIQQKQKKLRFTPKMPTYESTTEPQICSQGMKLSIPPEANLIVQKQQQCVTQEQPKDANRRVRKGEETTLF